MFEQMKFNTDEFLAHFFKKDETVIVNADALQRFIREARAKEAELKRAKKQLQTTLEKLEKCKIEKEMYELDSVLVAKYKLDLVA